MHRISKAALVKAQKVTAGDPGPRPAASGDNLTAMARHLGVTSGVVRDAMRHHGMWPVSPKALEAKALYETGLDREEVADALGHSVRHTARLLIEAKTVMRPAGRRAQLPADLADRIVKMRAKGDSWLAIANATGVPISTVRRWA